MSVGSTVEVVVEVLVVGEVVTLVELDIEETDVGEDVEVVVSV